jgi:hypothetical protein
VLSFLSRAREASGSEAARVHHAARRRGGAAASWPLAARAQIGERKRRIGVLWEYAADDPATGPPLSAFRQTLEQLGWSEDRNVDIDYRFAGGRSDRYLPLAQELIASRPDVIVATGTPITATLQRETRALPIVFTAVSDPIGAGFVASLARPGGNITGMLHYEAGIIGKWLAMLKEIAPRVTRAALVGNPKTSPFHYFQRAAEAPASSLAIELVPATIENSEADIERVIGSFAATANGGLVVLPDTTTVIRRDPSSRSRPGTICPRSTMPVALSIPEVSWHMAFMGSTRFGRQRVMSTASSVVLSRPTCRCRHPPSMKPSSISKPQSRWGLKSRHHCLSAPTR